MSEPLTAAERERAQFLVDETAMKPWRGHQHIEGVAEGYRQAQALRDLAEFAKLFIPRVLADLEEAKRDTERMDWLEGKADNGSIITRAAIDAARANEPT